MTTNNNTANKSSVNGILRNLNEIDMKKLTFGEPEINKYGGKSCSVKYDGKPFAIQAPRCRCPFGLGQYDETDAAGNVVKSKYSLDISLTGYELREDGEAYDPRVRSLYDLAERMEGRLQEEALKNSGEWLGMEDANEGVAKALTRPVLRWSKDKKTKKITAQYPPNVKFKVGFWDNRWLVKAFDENKERIEDLKEGIPKGSEVIAIVKITGVNFAGGKVGYSLSLSQVKVYAPKGMPSYAFVDDEDDDKPVVSGNGNRNDDDGGGDEDVAAPVDSSNKVVDSDNDSDDDSDDDDDDDDDELDDEEEAPAPVKAKKIVKRRKKNSED